MDELNVGDALQLIEGQALDHIHDHTAALDQLNGEFATVIATDQVLA